MKKNPETGKYERVALDTAQLQVVCDGSEENKKFFESTPTGKLEVGLHREGAFEVGKEYYIDIMPAS